MISIEVKVEGKGSKKLPFFYCTHNGKKVRLLFDSGANINIIDERSELLPKIKTTRVDDVNHFATVRYTPILRSVKVYDGCDLVIKDPRLLNLTFTGLKIDGVVGTKFLTDNKITDVKFIF